MALRALMKKRELDELNKKLEELLEMYNAME